MVLSLPIFEGQSCLLIESISDKRIGAFDIERERGFTYMLRTNTIEHFKHRVIETIAWCESQDWSYHPPLGNTLFFNPLIVPGRGLRSDELRPTELSEEGEMVWETDNERQQIVEQLASKRAALLQKQGSASLQTIDPLAGGRVLAFNPDGSTSDSALYDFTQGFIDGHNLPAWDTWICYVTNDPVSNLEWWRGCDSYLLSWVPNALIEGVETGIAANSDECVRWAADLDSAFIQQLRQAGLLC